MSEDVLMPGELDRAWRDLLFVRAGNVRVWSQYLLHHQSKLAGFSVSPNDQAVPQVFEDPRGRDGGAATLGRHLGQPAGRNHR